MIGRVIGLIVIGLIVGALGRLVHPGADSMGIGVTIVIGIVSALVAGLLIHGLLGFILAVVIAAVLVGVAGRTMAGRSA